jgi:hypothetical protein
MFIGQTVRLNSRLLGDKVETWAASGEGGVHYRVQIELNP